MTTRLVRVAWGAALAAMSCLSPSLVSPAAAQPIANDDIPPVLRPWVPWVLANDADYGCTSAESSVGGSDPICVWPSSLRVEIHDGGATFAMDVTSDRETTLALPGSGRVWPLEVRMDGHAVPVLADGDTPIVAIGAGAHRVEGRLSWTTAPDTLDVPADVARVVLVQGGATRVAARDTDGSVWLHGQDEPTTEDSGAEQEADSVSLEVYRQITDGVPLEIITRIAVHVAGHPREMRLGAVLPAGAVPIAVSADLATRVTEQGELTLQLHAGTFDVEIRAMVPSPEAPLAPPPLPAPWPEQEVWTWVPSETFRQVEVTGASSIDPARTTLPTDWRSHSAYLVEPTSTVTLTTTRRGEPTPPPNTLTLRRSIWLDADGGGASVSDELQVEMHDGFRIDLDQGVLGRVAIQSTDQLITRASEGGPAGVELRDTNSIVDAEWRLEESLGRFRAVGWSEDAQSVSTTLDVGPGWQLIHASGVDRADGSWSQRWTLLGFFALLLVTVVVGRVYGIGWGAAAFVGVGLAYHADGAPRWIWVALAVTLALHRALGARAIAEWVRRLYLVLVIAACVIAVMFAAQEARVALHPALDPEAMAVATMEEETPEWLEEPPADEGEGGTGRRHRDDEGAMGEADSSAAASRYGILGSADTPDPHMAREEARDVSSSYGWMDPSAVVQTGFGCPTWTWRRYALELDGPVGHDHEISLWLSPPWLTQLLGLLRAALALALCFVAIRQRPASGTPSAPDAKAGATPAAAAAVAMITLVLVAAPSVAFAQASVPPGPIPSPEMLTELANRLAWTEDCGDHCAEASAMRIHAHGDVLAIDIELGVTVTAAYPLPGPVDSWSPSIVTLDGQPARSLVRLGSGFVHVRVPPGAHTLHVEGSLAGSDTLTLALGRAPRTIDIATEGWETDGSGTGPHVPESIQLRRAVASEPVDADATDATEAGAPDAQTVRAVLPSWLVLERRFEIGVRWNIVSTLRRLSTATAADVARVALLPGESVTDSSVVIDGTTAVVTLGQHDAEVTWTSVLDPRPEIALTAPASGHLSTTWTLACTPLWHCTTTGVTPTASASSSRWEPRFDPWPGESLTIALARPDAIAGQSTTIDWASLSVQPGARLSTATLALHVRTSVSAPLTIALPADADVRTLSVDGGARPLQRADGTLTVTLQPGAHDVRVEWQEGQGWTTFFRTPEVRLGENVVNLTLDVSTSDDRWLLWIAGPIWGPAVLIWPYALVILIVAYALSRRRELLPTLADWILLGIGLTQVPALLALFVIGWFFAIEWRRATPLGTIAFDLRQIVVAGYTLSAAIALVIVIRQGLLGTPGMDVVGPGTYEGNLHFFVDRSEGALPQATVITVPVVVFRVLMFSWAGWLALAVVRWARRAWSVFAEGGLWRVVGAAAAQEPVAEQPAAPVAESVAASESESGSESGSESESESESPAPSEDSSGSPPTEG